MAMTGRQAAILGFVGLLAVAGAGAWWANRPQSARAETDVMFLDNLADAREQARQTGKPIFIHFTTDWCGWCRKIERDVYGSAQGAQALTDFIPVSLDCTVRGKQGQALAAAQANKRLMDEYGGRGYPFLVVLAPDGTLLHKFSGYRPVGQFVEELNQARQKLQQRGS